MDYNLDKSYTDKQNEILKAITKEEVNALAKKHLQLDKMAILVVGDKSKVFVPLTKLGYEVVELDADGNVVKGPEVKKDVYRNNDLKTDPAPTGTQPNNTVTPQIRNAENPR